MKAFSFRTISNNNDLAKIMVLHRENTIIITKRILTKEYKLHKHCGMYLLRKMGGKYYMEARFSIKVTTLAGILRGLLIDEEHRNDQ